MSNVTRINWFVLVYLTIWCWVDGFTTTAFGLTVLVLTEALWKPFIKSKLAIKLFGADTMAEVLGQQKSATSRH
ncbi:hypothetical protein ACLUWI_03145 [Limosilactobacillus mucosae]|uniref:hypothetical protein n=1 Tax=Limosilactobacillus mucosae TaxID=97478 RepID=UPI003994C7FA